MIKTVVFEKDGAWWLKWSNFVEPGSVFLEGGVPTKAPDEPLAQGLDGPFSSKEEAELSGENFVKDRKEHHPYETFESE
jgi:hypothetical protein